MRRTTIYLEPDLEVLLKLETQRRGTTMAELIREAIRAHVQPGKSARPPGAGAFSSRVKSTASDTRAALAELGFGDDR